MGIEKTWFDAGACFARVHISFSAAGVGGTVFGDASDQEGSASLGCGEGLRQGKRAQSWSVHRS